MEYIKIIANTWQFNVIMVLIFSVIYNQSYKFAVTGTKKDGISTVIFEFIGGLSMLLLIPFFSFKSSFNYWLIFLFIFALIFYTVSDRLQTTVRKNLEVSTFSIINQFSKVFLIIYGLILFREPIIILKLIGAFIIIIGNIFLFYKKGRFYFNKYVWLSIISSFFIATAVIIDVDISKYFNIPLYIMITLIVPSVINFLFERCSLIEVFNEFNSERKIWYIITGLVWGFVIFFTIRAMQLGDVSFVTPIIASTVLLNVFVAYFLHREKDNFLRKVISALIVITGIILTII